MTDSITLPRNSSYSQLNSMVKCGLQWYLERGLRLPSRPSWAMAGGSAVHSATEEWDRNLLDLGEVDDSHEHAKALFDRAFNQEVVNRELDTGFPPEEWRATGRASKEWPDKRNAKWWRANGPLMVKRWMTWRLNSPWEIAHLADDVWGIELEAVITIAGIPVRMFIDRLMVHKGEYLILDVKTGDREPDDGTQLGIYAEGIEQAYGFRPQWGQYWMAKDGGTTPGEDLSKWSLPRLEHSFTSVRKMQEERIFLPHISPMCSACGVQEYCYAKDGAQAHTVPAPWEVDVRKPLDIPSGDVS